VSDGWFGKLFRTRILARVAAFAMTREAVRKLAFRTISQIGIRYPAGPLSQSLVRASADAPAAGDRFPWLELQLRADGPIEDLFQKLDDTRFNLLVFGQPAPDAVALGLGDLLRVLKIPAGGANAQELGRVGIDSPAFFLLRPDGHIGLAGARLEAARVTRYLTDRHFRAGVSATASRLQGPAVNQVPVMNDPTLQRLKRLFGHAWRALLSAA